MINLVKLLLLLYWIEKWLEGDKMKEVHVVVEYAYIEYEECVRVMGVFSSVDKAKSAMRTYEKESADSKWHHEYGYAAYELDAL